VSKVADELRELANAQSDEYVKKTLKWCAVELDDRAATILELDAEITEYSDGYAKLANALNAAKNALDAVSASIHAALWTPEPPAVDIAPFKNVMAQHGVEPYAKKKRVKKEKS